MRLGNPDIAIKQAALTHEFDFPPIAGEFEDAAIIFFAK